MTYTAPWGVSKGKPWREWRRLWSEAGCLGGYVQSGWRSTASGLGSDARGRGYMERKEHTEEVSF